MKKALVPITLAGLFMVSLVFDTKAQNTQDLYTSLSLAGTTEVMAATYGQTQTSSESIDYPTISYPATTNFRVDKDKATYHLSWSVVVPENVAYTEIQRSTDGQTFSTVGIIVNDGKMTAKDYFVPSEKELSSSFRIVQHEVDNSRHTSEVIQIP
jgi:hypothetical protein